MIKIGCRMVGAFLGPLCTNNEVRLGEDPMWAAAKGQNYFYGGGLAQDFAAALILRLCFHDSPRSAPSDRGYRGFFHAEATCR